MPIHGRGPQVMLEGYARTVARGAAGRTMRDNIAAMDALVGAGLAPDGNTVDGSSRTGGTPYDTVVAQFPRETLTAWAIPAPLLDITGGTPVSVLDYGADPTGLTDSTDAFRAALATGKSVYAPWGTYHITGQIVVDHNQTLFGDSRSSTILTIGPDFSTTDTGIISLTGREMQAPTVRDLQIAFAQPSNIVSRASMKTLAGGGDLTTGIMYPPAIVLTTANRFRILNVTISGAWDGIINPASNAGGVGGYIIDNIEMGALNCGLWLDNQFDFGHLKAYHFWPFGLNLGTTYSVVFKDGNTFAAKFGVNATCQALMVEDFSNFEGRVSIDNTNSWLHFVNLGMDGTLATLEIHNCLWVEIANMYTSGGANPNPQISLSGAGSVMINTMYGGGWISLTGGGGLYLDNVHPNAQQTTTPLIQQTGGVLFVRDSVLNANPSLGAWGTVPLVNCTGGTTVFTDNWLVGPAGGTTMPGITITTDSAANVVTGNSLNGWHWTPPGGLGFYGLNSDMISPRLAQFGAVAIQNLPNTSCFIGLHAAAAQQRSILGYTNNLLRWGLHFSNDAEAGANTGTDFEIARYDDTGVIIDEPLVITRATGMAVIPNLKATAFCLNKTTPIGQQTVAGAWAGNTAGKALCVALAAFGLIIDNTTA